MAVTLKFKNYDKITIYAPICIRWILLIFCMINTAQDFLIIFLI